MDPCVQLDPDDCGQAATNKPYPSHPPRALAKRRLEVGPASKTLARPQTDAWRLLRNLRLRTVSTSCHCIQFIFLLPAPRARSPRPRSFAFQYAPLVDFRAALLVAGTRTRLGLRAPLCTRAWSTTLNRPRPVCRERWSAIDNPSAPFPLTEPDTLLRQPSCWSPHRAYHPSLHACHFLLLHCITSSLLHATLTLA